MVDDDCPFCGDAEPTGLDLLFETINACLDGAQLDPCEPYDAMPISGKLNVRKLLNLLVGADVDIELSKLRTENEQLKVVNATVTFAFERMRDGKLVEITGTPKEEVIAMVGKPREPGAE